MVVVKLGGSLAGSKVLGECLIKVAKRYRDQSMVIVPGGGAFADQVRKAQAEWHFDDVTAHRMAILAMQQMALLYHGLQPKFPLAGVLAEIRSALSDYRVVIWSPNVAELEQAGVHSCWDVTSDSLAAWLAGQLSADELILVKSAKIDSSFNLAELVCQEVVDRAFYEYFNPDRQSLTVINYQEL